MRLAFLMFESTVRTQKKFSPAPNSAMRVRQHFLSFRHVKNKKDPNGIDFTSVSVQRNQSRVEVVDGVFVQVTTKVENDDSVSKRLLPCFGHVQTNFRWSLLPSSFIVVGLNLPVILKAEKMK